MDWIGPVIAGFSGAIAAGITQLIVGFKRERKGPYLVVFALLFVGLEVTTKSYVEPRIRAWEAIRELGKTPFYRELSEYDPPTYQRVKSVFLQAAQTGDSKKKTTLRVADVIGDVLPRYIPRASDDSVAAYVNWMSRDLDTLYRANPDACYAFLYPHKFGEPGLALKYLPSTNEDQDLQVLANIVESAIKNPQAEPDANKAEELLQPIFAGLAQKFGSDLSLLQATAKDSTERKKNLRNFR